jgi:hypothetical protein
MYRVSKACRAQPAPQTRWPCLRTTAVAVSDDRTRSSIVILGPDEGSKGECMAGAAHVSGRPQSVRLGSVDVKRINRERRDDLPPLSSESRAPLGHRRLPIQCTSDLCPTYKTSWSADSRKSLFRSTMPFRRDHAVHDCVQYRWLDISLFKSNRSDVIVKTLATAFSLVVPCVCRPSGRLDQRASPSCCNGPHSVGTLHIGW